MEDKLFEKYSSLPKIILEREKTYTRLLDDEIIEKYYYKDMRREIDRWFNKLNYLNCLCDFSISSNPLNEKVDTSNISDSVGKFVESKLDNNEWAINFYNGVVSLSKKLTKEEGIYMVYTFFINNSEEKISEELNISRFTLQKNKKELFSKNVFKFK